MKIVHAMFAGAVSMLGSGVALAQSEHMMGADMGGHVWVGGYNGILAPILIIIAAVGLVTWFVRERRK